MTIETCWTSTASLLPLSAVQAPPAGQWMSGKGNGYDNAIVETVFKTIKNELVWQTVFQTRKEATIQLGKYIDGFYNRRRRHSALGYQSPIKFEAEMTIKK